MDATWAGKSMIELGALVWESHASQGRGWRLYWLTEKRRVLSDKPEDPRLTALLDRTPNRALTIAYNRSGDPW